MKKREIVDLGIAQYSLFWENYRAASETGEQEAIHQLRVSLKRFYALKHYLLLRLDSRGQTHLENHLEPLRLIYKAGGKVRDIQIIRQVAGQLLPVQASGALIGHLIELELQRFEKFKDLSKIVVIPAMDVFSKHFERVIRSHFQKGHGPLDEFLTNNAGKAIGYICNTEAGEMWHDARRLIKQNYLLMQLARGINPHRFENTRVQYYRNLEQLLGDWHDRVVLKKYALRYDITRASEDESYLSQVLQDMKRLEAEISEMAAIKH